MALTTAQATQLTQLAQQYDGSTQTLSFVDWLKAKGASYAALASALVATLTANGDTQTLAEITKTPAQAAQAAAPQLTPQASWAHYAQPSAAPASGKAWGLSASGTWRQVPIAPGGKFSGAHYIPPQRPGGPREPASADVRFTDPKRIAACATCLASDWKALFFRVAPRGAPDKQGVSPGIGTLEAGIDYYYEGGDIYPTLSTAKPADWASVGTLARQLWDWWWNPPWGSHDAAAYYTRNESMGWYRVYVDDQGFRDYKNWTLAELQQFRLGYMLAAPGYQCPRQEVFRDAMYDVGRNCKIDMHGTKGTVLKVCQVFPLARCSVSQTDKRNQMIKEAAAVAGVVAAAVFLPEIAPKLVAGLKTLGGKIGGALKSQFTGRISSAIQGQKQIQAATAQTHAAVTTAQESPPAGASYSSPPPPPPPSNAPAADTALYAQQLAQWYAAQHAASTGQPGPTPAEQAQIAAETQRFLSTGAQVAAGTTNPDVAAATLATSSAGGLGKTGLLLGAAALGAVLIGSHQRAA